MGRKSVSISEVATAAGVSVTTVSHALSGNRPVSQTTLEKVRRAMRDLGYVPSHAAQSLASGTTNTIGLLVPDITNVFFASLARGVEDAADRHGFSLILGNTDFDPGRERRYLDVIRRRAIDGLVYAAGAPPSPRRISKLADDFPVALADEEIQGVEAITVVSDHGKGGRMVGEHLSGLGHRKVLVISGPAGLISSSERMTGFRRAFRGDVDIAEGDFREPSGYDVVDRRLADAAFPHTAVFALNDMMALGAMRALRDHGLAIPDDVAVVGYDDVPIAAAVTPALTTVAQPVHQIGATAAVQLLDALRSGQHPRPSRHVLDVELVIRNSCGATEMATVAT